MKKIIVPIDFSELSEYALKAAAKIARENNTEILVLNMLEMSDIMVTAPPGGNHKEETSFFIKLAEQELKLFLTNEFLTDLRVTPIVKQFKASKEINEIAHDYDAELIVMGCYGVHGVKEFILGSNTERIVRNSNIPVLIVKKELQNINFENIVFACDFKEETIRPYISMIKMLDKQGAKISLVYVNLPGDNFKSSEELEERAINFLNKAEGNLERLKNVHYVSDYSSEKGILNFSKKINADLIAIPTHGRKGISHFLEGSVCENIAKHTALPVMTFKI